MEGDDIVVSCLDALRRNFLLTFVSVSSNVGSATKGLGQSLPLPPGILLGRFWWGESTCGATIADGIMGDMHILHTLQKWGQLGQHSCGDDQLLP